MINIVRRLDDSIKTGMFLVAKKNTRLTLVDENSRSINLGSNVPGLYWIYTNYSDEEIISSVASSHPAAIKISILAKQHRNLKHVIKACNGQGFRIVYNGIGTKLRSRILAEFGNGSNRTGCLAISGTTLNDLSRWRFSYVTCQMNLPGLAHNIEVNYTEYARTLERTWRLEYGWPLLCRT